MLSRLGCALLLTGLILLLIFLVTFLGQQSDLATLLWAIGLISLGWLLRHRKKRLPAEPPSRFRLIRRLFGRRHEDSDEI